MSDDTHTHRVVSSHRRGPDLLRAGDTFTPTESELAAFGNKFERIDDAETEDTVEADDDAEDGSEDSLPEPESVTDMTVEYFRSFVREYADDIDDAYLSAALDAEESGDGRTTIISEINDRLDTSTDPDAEA